MSENAPVQIAGRPVGRTTPPFIVAEMSGNHNQSLERALQIVDAAANAGAHALKLQTYTADTMTLNVDLPDFRIQAEDNPWTGYNLYQLYEQAFTPWEWHEEIFRHARKLGMIPFSTPFDETAVDFLEDLDAPAYKIASFENNHLPLIRKAAATGKPLIISTGMASLAELDEAVHTAREAGCQELILLKCTSSYPASPQNSNIITLPHMRTLFDCEVGLSDHTLGIGAAVASVALGASFIEKHVTLDRGEGGVDADFSLEPPELQSLVEETERAWQAIGQTTYGPTPAERNSMTFRRSLYIATDIQAGDCLDEHNLRIVRPGHGLPPRHYPHLLGCRVNQDLKAGTAMQWKYITGES